MDSEVAVKSVSSRPKNSLVVSARCRIGALSRLLSRSHSSCGALLPKAPRHVKTALLLKEVHLTGSRRRNGRENRGFSSLRHNAVAAANRLFDRFPLASGGVSLYRQFYRLMLPEDVALSTCLLGSTKALQLSLQRVAIRKGNLPRTN